MHFQLQLLFSDFAQDATLLEPQLNPALIPRSPPTPEKTHNARAK
jgi:hypothetical protein